MCNALCCKAVQMWRAGLEGWWSRFDGFSAFGQPQVARIKGVRVNDYRNARKSRDGLETSHFAGLSVSTDISTAHKQGMQAGLDRARPTRSLKIDTVAGLTRKLRGTRDLNGARSAQDSRRQEKQRGE